MYPPGYGQPGMMQPGYPGMYAPPPPGFFGQAATGLGFGGASGYEQTGAQQAGGALLAGGAVSAMSSVPTGLATGIGMAGMIAPFMRAGSSTAFGRAAWGAVDAIDPTTHVLPAMGRGAQMGFGVGSRMMGLGNVGGFGGAGRMLMGAFQTGGMRAGLGMGARLGAAGAMGGGAALAAGALPLAAGMAAFEGLRYTGEQFYQGASDTMQGQALMNQMGASIAPGQSMKGQGAETGRMMRDLSSDLGVGMDDVGRYAKQLDSQKVFQTTRSAKEFRTKFKEVMKAVKEIAQVTQSSVDDAMQMFGDMRQQGFYTTADMKAQAASRQAREMTTGISSGVFSAVGGAGAQMSRQYGMRGRFGSDLAQRNVAGVAMGVRSGAMSEEEVMEMGGVEQVGLRMSQKQMGFLGSARGRAMIAYSMGEGGAPDMDRLSKILRGTSMEDIVTGAAGRGLGVLQKAGTREAKEAFMPYAGMAMVQMAASQQKQLYGGVSRKGILGMLGTMGVGRQEAEIMLQQTMQMPEQLRREQEAQAQAQTAAEYERLQGKYSFTGRMSSALDRNVGQGLRGAGSRMYSSLSRTYASNMEKLTGGETYTGGDDALARRALASGGLSGALNTRGQERSPLLGLPSASRRIQQQYSGMTFTGEGMNPDELQAGLKSGDIIDLGIGGRETAKDIFLGLTTGGAGGTTAQGRRYVRRSDVEKGERSYTEGLKKGASPQGSAALGLSLGRGDFMQELHASRRKELSKLGGVGMAASLAMDIGIGGATLSDLDLTGQMSEVERQHDVFFAAKKAKIIEDDVDFRQYMAKSQEEKLGILGQTTAALKDRAGRGDQTSQKMLDRIGGEMETGLMQTRDIQAARDQFGKQVDQLLTDEFGGFGSSVFGGKQSKLAQTLTKSGKARASYDGYMRELLKGGGRDDQALMAYEEKLKEEFGEDSPEYRAIQSQRTKLEKDPAALERFKKAYEGPGGMGQLFTDRALIEKVHKDSEGLRKRVSGINMENIRDPGLRATVAKLGAAAGKGDIEGRTSAMSDLILGSISGGISDEERRVLSEVGGAGQGEQVASFVSALQTGKVSKGDQAMLKEAGFDEAKIKEIAKLQGEEQAEAIKKVFQEAGLTDLAMFQSSEGAADKRGVQTQYVDANKDFVLAVHAFVSALGSVKGIDLPAIPGPSAKLTEGGSSPSGGNT